MRDGRMDAGGRLEMWDLGSPVPGLLFYRGDQEEMTGKSSLKTRSQIPHQTAYAEHRAFTEEEEEAHNQNAGHGSGFGRHSSSSPPRRPPARAPASRRRADVPQTRSALALQINHSGAVINPTSLPRYKNRGAAKQPRIATTATATATSGIATANGTAKGTDDAEIEIATATARHWALEAHILRASICPSLPRAASGGVGSRRRD
ncbi:hypothetical protein DFH06DRAFT_1143024 [Mycena polygramma]|nr:hypothetical protein DFH06DRAFT_1143024 [Mycena polygramma]